MAQITINNGEDGLDVRTALNSMFTELYSTITQPLKFPAQAASFQTTIKANTFVASIFAALAATVPTVRIGVTPNGTELSGDITPDANGLQIAVNQYFAVDTIVYFTISGGSLNFRINIIPNFY